jgi:uncharacterized protein with PQ loop repeat
MLNVIGWLGSICFSICAIPQAVLSIKQGHSDGTSSLFLGLWLLGEVCTIAYVLPKLDYPLLVNYIGNLACLLVILRYKIRPRS